LVDAINRNDLIVNPALSGNYDMWCPGCQGERKLAGKAVWLTVQEEYVCTYGVCAACLDRVQALSDSPRAKFLNLVWDRLEARYPFLT
jgi:hypothetical protein